MTIQHKNEPKGNRIRKQVWNYVGIGQSTYTPTQLCVANADGCWLWSVDGRQFLDFTSGVLVQNLGYNHPKFDKYMQEYQDRLPRNAYNMVSKLLAEASKRIVVSMKKNPNAQKILWAASGSEAVQKAIWTTLHRYPDRPIMVGTRYGFHGKKGLAGDLSGDSSKNKDVRFISFPMDRTFTRQMIEKELKELSRLHKNKIACLITEPYLGAKGSYHPPAWYHKLLQQWCNDNTIPFIFDEIQSCFGRTGTMYAFEKYEVQPDLVVIGKGMANGEPAAAVVGRKDLIDSLTYGEASDTYSASTPACAAVCATLDIFKEEHILKGVKKKASILKDILNHLYKQYPFITEVRGEGMVFGIQVISGQLANRCVLEAYRATSEKGVHLLGPLSESVLRVSPPLTIKTDELYEAYALLTTAWNRISA